MFSRARAVRDGTQRSRLTMRKKKKRSRFTHECPLNTLTHAANGPQGHNSSNGQRTASPLKSPRYPGLSTGIALRGGGRTPRPPLLSLSAHVTRAVALLLPSLPPVPDAYKFPSPPVSNPQIQSNPPHISPENPLRQIEAKAVSSSSSRYATLRPIPPLCLLFIDYCWSRSLHCC